MKNLILSAVSRAFVVATALSACAPTSNVYEHWVGRGSMGALDILVELEVSETPRLAGEHKGQISVFGPAPLGYDFPLALAEEVTINEWDERTLHFAFTMRGQTIDAVLTRHEGDGVPAVARASNPNAAITMLLQLASAHAEPVDGLVGVYKRGDNSFAVMEREFGGLRLINALSGANQSLFALGNREFITASTVAESNVFSPDVWFSGSPAKEAQTLVIAAKGESKAFQRDPSVEFRPIEFSNGEFTLHGMAVLPESDTPVPGLVLVHGSGPIYGTALADRALAFAKMGVAVLIYDKRGAGRSEGNWRQATFEDLAIDADAALAALENLPEVDANRTGYQGHSEAGYVIPIATSISDKAEFAIIVNGGSVSPAEQTMFDKRNDLQRAGFSDADITEALTLLERIHGYVRDRIGDYAVINRDYLRATELPWFSYLDLPVMPAFPSWLEPPAALIEYAEELAFDPIKNQIRMDMPVLVVLGAADQTVPTNQAADGWRKSMTHNKSFSLEILTDAGHGMRNEDGILLPGYINIHRRWLDREVLNPDK